MSGFGAMVLNGFREARRNRVTVAVAAFAAVVLFSSSLVTEVTVATVDRVLTDFGLGMMSLILVFLAIFLACGLLSREIDRRTIFLVVSKPMSRAQFLLARLCGNMLTLAVLLVAMTVVFFAQLALYRTPITTTQLWAVVALWFELLVLTSAGFFFSTFASQMVSAIATVGLYFAGHLSGDIYLFAQRSESALLRGMGKAIYYVLPNLERMNFRPLAAYGADVPLGTALSGIGYGVAYSALLCVLAIAIFNRRDFR
ncbi:ABC transporter permease subunit [Aggregicoccus sp. 17bor-14]|uniref:ABC transporter permease n=1 Tax=Myxococcaceae TaxID=31 RepID=UPI00129CB645|nr:MULTISPECIES: ABC transporter permease [Myxococcaceae]MBF5044737.1 ABC transporter permease subunit [Simulacricoccus sp. 17bor-14]MRI90482.1 ABC transporter permease subunit [Aggregicoccus sp. 17bor-14]